MAVHHASDIQQLQRLPWFHLLAALGALYLGAITLRLLAYLGLPNFLRSRPRRTFAAASGRAAVVTRLDIGIGRSMAFELAPRASMSSSSAATRQAPGRLGHHHQDSRWRAETKTVKRRCAAPRGRDGLDVGLLVNNAGVAKPCAVYLHEFDVDAWVKMIRVNLWELTEVTAAVLPGMVARRRGAIVNIGSGSTEAIPSFPLYTIYAATKR
ncbi:unnamed protein product [Miscanthus lutarioriparius]|uniref:Uncharacterized protein n=1 Tax=Miscanthus lutarioriparius TaxID=422564 RepID=A0A811S6C2_9POAL|nr:unnamed protein product [Miscanthus lutarioriparius]